MAVGRRMPARSRSDFSCQTIELGFRTPTGVLVASDFSEGAEAVLPLEERGELPPCTSWQWPPGCRAT
jgi:hypothetical protein